MPIIALMFKSKFMLSMLVGSYRHCKTAYVSRSKRSLTRMELGLAHGAKSVPENCLGRQVEPVLASKSHNGSKFGLSMADIKQSDLAVGTNFAS